MAMRFGDDAEELAEAHDINVTPFIDVILVLLIIFMVAAPLSTVDVPVDLPTAAADPAARPDEPIYLTLGADLMVHIGENVVPYGGVGAALQAATSGDQTARIFVRADRKVPYGNLMDVLNVVRTAGYRRVSLMGLEAPSQ
jgi:biopolymer transport protein ExbD